MKIALAQINTATGDLEGNDTKIRNFLIKASHEKPDLVIFPELTLVGYPPRDVLAQHGFLEKASGFIQTLAKEFSGLSFIIGSVENGFNVAYFISKGKIQTVARKNLLPNYDVFDESRYFKSSHELQIIELDGKKIGMTVCEDIWSDELKIYEADPLDQFKGKNLDFIVNISASPFEHEKYEHRLKVVSKQAKRLSTPMIYVNLVGGNDELIFDGGSFVVDQKGELIEQAPFFEETLHVFHFFKNEPIQPQISTRTEVFTKALTLGLRDFVRKCGFQDVVLGLSGGIDSAVVLLLALEAFGKDHVHIVFMPSRFTSQDSKRFVSAMVEKLQIPVTLVPIQDMIDVFQKNLETTLEEPLKPLTCENIQSRIRGNILMTYSGQKNAMVLNTGNKSEIATGYCTLYGDTIGGVSPIGDLYKHQVYALGKFLNQKYKAIPEAVFTRAPSAELSENQKDSDRLPEYDTLDRVVEHYVEQHLNREGLINLGYTKEVVDSIIRMMTQSEFKRRQAPPILRVTKKAFGMGRRMPIARKQYEI